MCHRKPSPAAVDLRRGMHLRMHHLWRKHVDDTNSHSEPPCLQPHRFRSFASSVNRFAWDLPSLNVPHRSQARSALVCSSRSHYESVLVQSFALNVFPNIFCKTETSRLAIWNLLLYRTNAQIYNCYHFDKPSHAYCFPNIQCLKKIRTYR